MAFWGIEVKPKQYHTLSYGDIQGKLILTQATLGACSTLKKSILQCQVGNKTPVYLCSLLPEKIESCSLNLEFDEEEDVKFSVFGSSSIHLSGFIQGRNPYSDDDDEHHVYGEDIGETESTDFSEDSEDEYESDFINDDDLHMFPVRNGGVVIEEIDDDENPAIEKEETKKPVKKKQAQIVLKGTLGSAVLESEDEDGLPISSNIEKERASEEEKKKNKKIEIETKDDAPVKNLKRKADETPNEEELTNQSGVPEERLKKKKKKKAKSVTETLKAANSDVDVAPGGEQTIAGEGASFKNKKKEKKKNGKEEEKAKTDTIIPVEKVSATEDTPKKSKAKPGNVRNYDNGLVIETLEIGKPDAKRASRGKKVSVRYIGKLQKNGKIFDSNIGKAPLKFILGVAQVIKGWDVGVEGMRVGDKRKLTIPPSMAYGAKKVGPIPPNSWLVFDVELVHTQ